MPIPDPVECTHERLDVYRVSIELLAKVVCITADLPRGHGSIADQFRRAAQSIPLNIAEGCGRSGDSDAARHYAIARGSALECAAAVDVIRVLGIVQSDLLAEVRTLLVRVVQMLSKMCR